jgi:hypothetical protein
VLFFFPCLAFLLSMMFSRSIRADENGTISFLKLKTIPLCVCMCACVIFIHSSTNGHLDCFHILVIIINTAMNIQDSGLISFEDAPNRGIAVSKGNSTFMFFRKLHSVFHNG